MKYKKVELHEKKAVGLCAKTSNSDPEMQKTIGGLWQNFFAEGHFQAIQGKVNDKAIGLYTDYQRDGGYTAGVCCEVLPDTPPQEGLTQFVIPAGTYAKFVIKGHMQKAVSAFWEELWNIDLDRKYTCDFEEYQNASVENAEIHIYIALN